MSQLPKILISPSILPILKEKVVGLSEVVSTETKSSGMNKFDLMRSEENSTP